MPSASATQLYDALLGQLLARPELRVADAIARMLPLDAGMPLSEQLAQIDQLKSWLDSFRPLPAAVVSELKQRYDVRFTYTSNAIEGNTLTQSETELVLSRGITVGGKTLSDHLEVIGHKDAIDYIEKLSQTDTPIGEWEIRQIHNLVLRRLSPAEAGRYRQLDVQAAGTGHVYPPHYLLPGLMADFVEWVGRDRTAVHPVIYVSEAHYRFVSIHPFADGNGRTGRLLMNLLLMQVGFPVVSISNEKRETYLNAIVAAHRSQDEVSALAGLICESLRVSLVETLAVVASAAGSKGKGLPFYREMVDFLAKSDGCL